MFLDKIVLVCVLWHSIVLASNNTERKAMSDDPPTELFFVFAGLCLAGILRALTNILNIPLQFRLFILFVGAIIGVAVQYSNVVDLHAKIVTIQPNYVVTICLPTLMFKTAFCIDAHTFVRSWGQIFCLAVPGLLINAFFMGTILTVLLNHNWSYVAGLMFGAICSSIYPAEIVVKLKEIEQAKHLSTLLEGEGLLGDGTIMIMFEILLGIIHKDITTWYHALMVFSRFALGGIAFGLVTGKIAGGIMTLMYSDFVNMLIFTMMSAYLTYYIGKEFLSVSGVIAVVVLGIMVNMERTRLSVDMEVFLILFWDILVYVTNTMVFLAVGIDVIDILLFQPAIKDYAMILITYLVATVARLLEYILLAPIISRIGYGLTLPHMTVAIWSGLRGAVSYCLILKTYQHESLIFLRRESLIHVTGLVVLTLLINATTMPILLKLMGLLELSMARKVNMNNCMRHLQNRRERTISMLKMDRFLSDANWPLVDSATILKHPYKINFSDSDEEEENYLGFHVTTCPDCKKEIQDEPTTKEMAEMIKEARMRILKAKKTSYARQYENGMLSKEGIRILTHAVEIAMDTPQALIELNGLHRYFKRQGFIHSTRKRLLAIFFKKSESTIKPPRKYWRRVCYHIIMHPVFDVIIYCAILLNVIFISIEFALSPKSGTTMSLAFKMINTFFFLVYFIEFVLKIYGYSWIYVCKHGFRTYFRSFWNKFDFLVLVACLADLTLDYVDLFSESFNKTVSTASKVITATKLIRILKFMKLTRFCKTWYPRLIKYCDTKIDNLLAYAYDVGKGFVTGEEEVSGMLIQMIDNKTIREDCRLRMEADRLAITKELGMIQKDRPWIAITVKTRQAIRTILNSMAEAVSELRVSGLVDDVEYAKLMESLEEKVEYVRTKIKSVQPSPPDVMFKEVPWMADDELISDFLYEHVVTKIFDQGDVVCMDGEMSDGIYIIVTGLLKLQYVPKKEVLYRLAEYGSLPIIDYISSTRFDEKVEDYIVSGNCIGELSVLTGRPYDCKITADTASQAYILTHDVMKQAIQRSPDPVNGLESKMWKYLSIRLATTILMDTPVYQSLTQEKIRYQLERAFVPNLSNYKVFGVNELMEDIVLIEGVAFDYNSRDCYTAPCYISRTVQKLVLPNYSHMNLATTIKTKLLIIPAQDVDEYDVMEREDEICEMVSTASVECLQHLIRRRSSRQKRKKRRQTTFAYRRVKYSESRTSASQSISRMTKGSLFETELKNISMNEVNGNNVSAYITQERRISKTFGKQTSVRPSVKETSNLEPTGYKKPQEPKQDTVHQETIDKNIKEKAYIEHSNQEIPLDKPRQLSEEIKQKLNEIFRLNESDSSNIKEIIKSSQDAIISKHQKSQDVNANIPPNAEIVEHKKQPSLSIPVKEQHTSPRRRSEQKQKLFYYDISANQDNFKDDKQHKSSQDRTRDKIYLGSDTSDELERHRASLKKIRRSRDSRATDEMNEDVESKRSSKFVNPFFTRGSFVKSIGIQKQNNSKEMQRVSSDADLDFKNTNDDGKKKTSGVPQEDNLTSMSEYFY